MNDMEKGLELLRMNQERSRRIRAVVTDMDGSFLNENSAVSPANANAVKKLREAGIHFMVCTGRSLYEAGIPLKEAGISCDIIAMNGAAVYAADGTQKKQYTLSMDKIKEAMAAVWNVKDKLILHMVTDCGEFIIAEEDVFRHFFLTRIFAPKAGVKRTREEEEKLLGGFIRTTADEFLKKELQCYKMVTLSEDTGLIRQIEPELKSIDGVCVAASFPTNWEITHENASKGKGLYDYAEELGYSLREVMAVGDGDNDMSMIALPLGWSVAMGNGSKCLKEAADVITLSNKEDGFAAAVEALLSH